MLCCMRPVCGSMNLGSSKLRLHRFQILTKTISIRWNGKSYAYKFSNLAYTLNAFIINLNSDTVVGFDVDDIHGIGSLLPYGCTPTTTLFGKLGLHCYNFDEGTNLQLGAVKKSYAEFVSSLIYYITLKARDPINNSLIIFQTCVWDAATKNKESLRLITKVCRIKPQVSGTGDEQSHWDPSAVDEFYKDNMCQWLEDDTLTGSDKLQYYEVKELDLQDNEWLYLYAEVALFSKWAIDLSAYLPLEIKRVVVQTKEVDVESSMKLKSKNVNFYLSFKAHGGPDCRGIIRRTTDERP